MWVRPTKSNSSGADIQANPISHHVIGSYDLLLLFFAFSHLLTLHNPHSTHYSMLTTLSVASHPPRVFSIHTCSSFSVFRLSFCSNRPLLQCSTLGVNHVSERLPQLSQQNPPQTAAPQHSATKNNLYRIQGTSPPPPNAMTAIGAVSQQEYVYIPIIIR